MNQEMARWSSEVSTQEFYNLLNPSLLIEALEDSLTGFLNTGTDTGEYWADEGCY